MKLCVDCRWIQIADDIRLSRCGHTFAKHIATSPVDGSQRSFQVSCEQFRSMGDGCGEGGNFWRPKTVEFK
jgi:hypothetical protein